MNTKIIRLKDRKQYRVKGFIKRMKIYDLRTCILIAEVKISQEVKETRRMTRMHSISEQLDIDQIIFQPSSTSISEPNNNPEDLCVKESEKPGDYGVMS